MICDGAARRALVERIEASRAVHRAAAALASVPALHDRLCAAIAGLPDVCDVPEAIAFLTRARVAVECSRDIGPQQRRMALSLLDASLRKLGA